MGIQNTRGMVSWRYKKSYNGIFLCKKKQTNKTSYRGVCIIQYTYEGGSISNQPNLFPVEIHLLFFDVIAV